ncbi:BQ5605_C002g01352 [Microbotryum silenes-dioicae]|uniref:BQ5605_C002g01352 protein n=1 Tax=Microbotryum silenes-dioicae TaxID=796604 RepID=A0A2X0M2B7_9BASI|nr:BQ5605_C002g01352 [Microbotryum silenes-dioicae]
MFDHALSTYCSVTIYFAPPPSMGLFRAGYGRGSDGLWGVCCGRQDWRGFIAGEAHKMSKYGEGVHSLGLDDGLGLGLDQARSIIMHHHDSSC